MFNVNHKTLMSIAGAIWMGIGLFLLQLGLKFLVESVEFHLSGSSVSLPVLSKTILFSEVKWAALTLVLFSLMIGFVKGRFVLSKTVQRSVQRIKSLPNPTSVFKLYSKGNVILIVVMMAIGMLMRILGVPTDVRACIDMAVGSALIQGGMLYFRQLRLPLANHSVG